LAGRIEVGLVIGADFAPRFDIFFASIPEQGRDENVTFFLDLGCLLSNANSKR
jgi:hypothetical protein